MHTVIVQGHILMWPVPIMAGMPIWPQQHGLSSVQQPKFKTPFTPFLLSHLKFLQLGHVKLQIEPIQPSLIAPKRPCSHTIPPLIPYPILKVGRCERPENCCPLEVLQAIDRSECCPEGLLVAVVLGQVSQIINLAIVAPYNLAVLIIDRWPEEPVARRDDHIVKFVNLGRPFLVEFIQVKVE